MKTLSLGYHWCRLVGNTHRSHTRKWMAVGKFAGKVVIIFTSIYILAIINTLLGGSLFTTVLTLSVILATIRR